MERTSSNHRGGARATLSLAVALFLLAAPRPAVAAEAPETVAAVPHVFANLLEVDGTFVPAQSEEIAPDFEQYGGSLEVVEAALPGPVVKGQVIARLEEKGLKEEIDAKRLELELAEIAFRGKKVEADFKEEATAVALMEAVRRFQRAERDYERYGKEDLPMRIEEAELSMQSSRDRIEDQKEELAQLEKMYGEDDLTEETEEIVLRRTRRGLERSLIYHDFRERRHRVFLEISVPREQEDRKLALEKETMGFERTRKTTDLELQKSRLELEKARVALDKQARSLKDLEADRERLVIKAPCEGLLVGGLFAGEKWTKLETEGPILEEGEKLKNNTPFCTVLPPQTPHVRVTVDEKRLLEVKAGLAATVLPTVLPDVEIQAEVDSIARHGSGGKYAALLRLGKAERQLRPGFTCKVKIRVGEPVERVAIPANAVLKTKEGSFVFRVSGEEQERVKVEIGRQEKGLVEVLEGLAVGDTILRHPPQEKQPNGKDEKK